MIRGIFLFELELRKLRQSNNVHLEVVIHNIRKNTYKKTMGVSSFNFTYPTWIGDTSWGGHIYLNVPFKMSNVNTLYLLIGWLRKIFAR